MTHDDDMDLIHGSGNVFRDLGLPNPEVEQLKAILAAKIIGILDDQKLTVRRAHELTGLRRRIFRAFGKRSFPASPSIASCRCWTGSTGR